MASIKTNANIKDIKGSIGENIFSSNKGQQYIRSKPKHSSNPQSANQATHRGFVSQFSKQWNDTLTQEQRNGWENYTKTLGQQGSNISGFNAYLKNKISMSEFGAYLSIPQVGYAWKNLLAPGGRCIGTNIALDYILNKTSWSILMWVKIIAIDGTYRCIWDVKLDHTNLLVRTGNLYLRLGGTTTNLPVPSLGTWHLLGVIFNSTGQSKYWLDGVKTNISASITTSLTNNNLMIGDWVLSLAIPLNAEFDEMRVFNFAISDAQYTDIYNLGLGKYSVDYSPVVAYHCDENGGAVIDNAGVGGAQYDATLAGTYTWSLGKVTPPPIIVISNDPPLGITQPDPPKNLTAIWNTITKGIDLTWTAGTIPGQRIGIWIHSVDVPIHKQLVTNEDITYTSKSISQVKGVKGATLSLSALKGFFDIQAQACDSYGQLSQLTKLITGIRVT